jgi:hypothetical protein
LAIEPDLVANLIADAAAALGGHAPRCRPRRQAPWFQQENAPTGESSIEQCGWHARRLARASRGAQHGVRPTAQGSDYVG